MNARLSIHGVAKVERRVDVYHEGLPTQFVSYELTIRTKDGEAHQIVLFIDEDANHLDVLDESFTYSKA